MSDVNVVVLTGRLTKDPIYKVSESGVKSARYTLANNFRVKENEGANFISCVAFNNNAEFANNYLKKGTKISVEGKIRTSSYQKDDQTVYVTEVVVNRQDFAEAKKSDDFESTEEMPEDVPFR